MGSTQALARGDNPFAKMDEISVGSDVAWQTEGKKIFKSYRDDDTWYHLSVDGPVLRLRMGGAQDDAASAKAFSSLAIEDLTVDGSRLPIFQWCLSKQSGHNRFLEQGQSVERGICKNNGSKGEFTVQLTQQTLDALRDASDLGIKFKPFRKSIMLRYDMAGFSDKLAALTAPKKRVQQAAVKEPARAVSKQCVAKGPASLTSIASIPYACEDAVARQKAERTIAAAVKVEKERIAALAAQRDRERQAKLEEQKRLEAERLKAQQEEEAAIAQSQEQSKMMMNEITNKMLGICNKMWGKGEHRCYCDKYLEHAPAEIQAKSCS